MICVRGCRLLDEVVGAQEDEWSSLALPRAMDLAGVGETLPSHPQPTPANRISISVHGLAAWYCQELNLFLYVIINLAVGTCQGNYYFSRPLCWPLIWDMLYILGTQEMEP